MATIVGTTIASMMATESIRMVMSAAATGPCGSNMFIGRFRVRPCTNAPPLRQFQMGPPGAGARLSVSLPAPFQMKAVGDQKTSTKPTAYHGSETDMRLKDRAAIVVGAGQSSGEGMGNGRAA